MLKVSLFAKDLTLGLEKILAVSVLKRYASARLDSSLETMESRPPQQHIKQFESGAEL